MGSRARAAFFAAVCALFAGCAHLPLARVGEDFGIPVHVYVFGMPTAGARGAERDPNASSQAGDCIFVGEIHSKSGFQVDLEKLRSFTRKVHFKGQAGIIATRDPINLRYLLPEFYYRVGYMRYFLIRRDQDGNIRRKIPRLRFDGWLAPRKLLDLARPGDEIIGIWDC